MTYQSNTSGFTQQQLPSLMGLHNEGLSRRCIQMDLQHPRSDVSVWLLGEQILTVYHPY